MSFSSLTGKLATNELPLTTPNESESGGITGNKSLGEFIIKEEDELEDSDQPATSSAPHFKLPSDIDSPKYYISHVIKIWQFVISINFFRYFWRIDLSKSEIFWSGWFQDLSQKFLDVEVPKLLLLASIDGLDRTLTVGQMQGKFQMQVLARCGHAVHEDRPHEVAEVIASFILRNKFSTSCGDFIRQMPVC